MNVKKKVFYIGFFGDNIAYEENRNIQPSAVNKMLYIAKSLKKIGNKVKIISPAWVKNNGKFLKITSGRNFKILPDIECSMPFSVSFSNRFFNIFSILISKVWLVYYVLHNIKKNDKVLVYNSPFYFSTIYYLKKIIGFEIILEIEEIYSEVFSMSSYWKRRENRLINYADKYLLANDLLIDNLRLNPKDVTIIYGTYERSIMSYSEKNVDTRLTRLVYAGIIDSLKLGAFNAIAAAKHLNEFFELHILGFGNKNDVNELISEIEQINKISKCKVYYHGKLVGDEYLQFMMTCDIGLSTQINDSSYVDITFPSKVLSYLCCGLNVLTGNIEVVKKSSIGSLVKYYSSDNSVDIANSILNFDLIDKKLIFNKIDSLSSNFEYDLKYKLYL